MYNISPQLQIRVEVLKDMLMYRVDKYILYFAKKMQQIHNTQTHNTITLS